MILVDNRNTTHPYLNLALEEYLVRHTDCSRGDYLLMYTNQPCVVLGKNQSIYREVNLGYLRGASALAARRVSGGGTVYHDEGNLSFAFISAFADKKVNNYTYFNAPIIKALQKAGIPAVADARNNILCNGKKVSGNAQFTNRKNIISHGTLLVNAHLTNLRRALSDNDFKIETRAVASVKSPVANLCDFTNAFSSTHQLQLYLAEQLNATQVHTLTDEEWSKVEELAAIKYSTYEWIYGRSPLTTLHKPRAAIVVSNGLIEQIDTGSRGPDLSFLKGVRYAYPNLRQALAGQPKADEWLQWLF